MSSSTITSDEVRQRFEQPAVGSRKEKFTSDEILLIREAAHAYQVQGRPRRFGASVRDLQMCGKRFCEVARKAGFHTAGDFDAFKNLLS